MCRTETMRRPSPIVPSHSRGSTRRRCRQHAGLPSVVRAGARWRRQPGRGPCPTCAETDAGIDVTFVTSSAGAADLGPLRLPLPPLAAIASAVPITTTMMIAIHISRPERCCRARAAAVLVARRFWPARSPTASSRVNRSFTSRQGRCRHRRTDDDTVNSQVVSPRRLVPTQQRPVFYARARSRERDFTSTRTCGGRRRCARRCRYPNRRCVSSGTRLSPDEGSTRPAS